jgi:hypothetical protein
MDVEINQRILEAEDYMRAKATLLSEFNSFISNQKTSWSSSFGPTNIDDSDNANREFSGSAKFTINIPDGTIDTEFATKFYLRMDIAAFESDLEEAATPAHDNGGVTGSHSGYGGGSTSNAGGNAHQVPSYTSIPCGSYTTVVVSGSSAAAGSHSHSVIASASPYNGAVMAGTGPGGSPSHAHSYTDYYCSSVSLSVGVLNGGDHSHALNLSDVGVAAATHPHTLPVTTTAAAATHPHTEDTYAAKSRAVFTEPQAANILTEFKKMLQTGSLVHYLDVYVTMNGSPISGSPFPNLYIGDTISDVDVSSLIIKGDNDLEVKIKEHTSSSIPVRCAIRGSLNATYYLPPNSF